ncbi:rod shape-determining protein MreC [Desulfotomaculum arcticum]|uniref:Cell shape-determining protein MreC n=1 Tax=Desulfotruncus arcticus DSM 17038 TaxID=1121424 RepID=A0A1I2UHD3_9FIRM|nr:rod shape-determining protein MreC [Desulfotruncus arcticus]SFG76470.1 rod shape-determining protein MreC [Desulfotomaculum arcticum] [Desulfotruncus arcticus DSM 17038]
MSRISGGKKLIFLGVLVIILLAGLHFTAGNMSKLTPLASATRDFLAPVQRVVTIAGREVSGFISFPVKLINVAKRNQVLEARVSELEGKLSQYQEAQQENTRLKQLLNFNDSAAANLSTLTAAVVARDSGNWFGSIIVNAGSKEGIKKDMAVITPAGLVGRVINVSADTAEVLLVTDPRSGVGCLVQDNRAPGVVEGVAGSRGELNMVHIPADMAPRKGDKIITSGFGSIYPKGIPVGTVLETQKEKSGLFKMASLKPVVDFNRLEEVLIITSAHPDGE